MALDRQGCNGARSHTCIYVMVQVSFIKSSAAEQELLEVLRLYMLEDFHVAELIIRMYYTTKQTRTTTRKLVLKNSSNKTGNLGLL